MKKILSVFAAFFLLAGCSSSNKTLTEIIVTDPGQFSVYEVEPKDDDSKLENVEKGKYSVKAVGGISKAASNGKKAEMPIMAYILVLQEKFTEISREQIDEHAIVFNPLMFPEAEIDLAPGDYLYIVGIDQENFTQNGEIQITKI